jgi:hypothetical protein
MTNPSSRIVSRGWLVAEDRVVVIRRFKDRFEADLAQSALDAVGIESIVRSDDCAGLYPQLAPSNGVELFVREDDLDRAIEILTEPAHDSN